MSKTSNFMEKQPVEAEGDKTLVPLTAKPLSKPQFGATAGGWAQTTVVRMPDKK
jgi:hypothetical protein